MKLQNTHSEKNHLFKKPHKWFLRLLSSPIRFAELHYKKKYHLRFRHARKLFIFDIALLIIIILTACTTIFWLSYDPSITKLVYLSIEPSSDRIISGEYIDYTIRYQNNSNTKMVSPVLLLKLPTGLTIDKIEGEKKYDTNQREFILSNLVPGQSGTLELGGWFFGTPHMEDRLTAELSYTQEDRKHKETKVAPLIQFHRGSVLETTIKAPSNILSQGNVPIEITLVNKGQTELKTISLPISMPTGLSLDNIEIIKGTIENLVWEIGSLTPDESTKLTANLTSKLPDTVHNILVDLTPSIKINHQDINQESVKQEIQILHPQINITSSWTDSIEKALPGETIILNLGIENTGDSELSDIKINLPLPLQLINLPKLLNLNTGSYSNGIFSINKNHLAGLSAISPGEFVEIKIDIPIQTNIQNTNPLLNITPALEVKIPVITNAVYQTSSKTPDIKIGSQLSLDAEIRYYTNEGDQLGRGPIPPQVGKQTKYWAVMRITNSTSKLSNLNFSAKLPNYVEWTGKTSVSHGDSVKYDKNTKTAYWTLNSLPTQTTVGIYLELAITPITEQVNTTPILLKNIQISATDTYINEKTTKTSQNLDSSMPNDLLAQNKGTLVQ